MAIFGYTGAIVCAFAAYQSRRDAIRCVGCVLIGLVLLSVGMSGR